jgi:hypothetical protein
VGTECRGGARGDREKTPVVTDSVSVSPVGV